MPEEGQVAAWLRHLGANPGRAVELEELRQQAGGEGLRTGRVVRAERGGAEVLTADGVTMVLGPEQVCTGDWVVIEPQGDPPRVLAALPRSTQIVRHSADKSGSQVLAADIDEVWLVVAAGGEISAGRLERSLVLAWESGAQPVVVLTKVDLLDDPRRPEVRAQLDEVVRAAPVLEVSALIGEGLGQLAARLVPGVTVALLGASGAGKSSLLNALVGAEVAEVSAVRAGDSKGRHTTAWRHLELLSNGAAVIDTPGLRAVGIWVDGGGMDATFPDIAELVQHCRFRDCSHTGEPGCAVRDAVTSGDLAAPRLERYQRLQQEAARADEELERRARRGAARRRR